MTSAFIKKRHPANSHLNDVGTSKWFDKILEEICDQNGQQGHVWMSFVKLITLCILPDCQTDTNLWMHPRRDVRALWLKLSFD